MTWTEEAFWACSWAGFLDAWTGYARFRLGQDPDDAPISRVEAEDLERSFDSWRTASR